MRAFISLLMLVVVSVVGDHRPAFDGSFKAFDSAVQKRVNELLPIAELVLSRMDFTVDPCNDYYNFSCASWIKANPAGDAGENALAFSKLGDRIEAFLEKTDQEQWPIIHELWMSCMNPAARSKGLSPLVRSHLYEALPTLKPSNFFAWLANFHASLSNSYGDAGIQTLVFQLTPWLNSGRSDHLDFMLAYSFGESLVEALYNTTSDEAAELDAFVLRALTKTGSSPQQAAMKLANFRSVGCATIPIAMLMPEDGQTGFVPMTVSEIVARAPLFRLDQYIQSLRLLPFNEPIYVIPAFLDAWQSILSNISADTLVDYFRVALLLASEKYLPADAFGGVSPFGDGTNFPPLANATTEETYQYCVQLVNNDLSDLLDHYFTVEMFSDAAHDFADQMVGYIRSGLGQVILGSSWLDEQTQMAAAKKLAYIIQKIGSPAKFDSFIGVSVDPLMFFENRMAIARDGYLTTARYGYQGAFNVTDLFISPETDVNAWYLPNWNTITIPAGILQQPDFDLSYPAALQFGGIGSVIGHELTHGFDNSGRLFGPLGKQVSWWTNASATNFDERTQCLISLFSTYTSPGGMHINGSNTLGENIADEGGLRASWTGFTKFWNSMNSTQQLIEMAATKIAFNGLTPSQVFFLGWSQFWCTSFSGEAIWEELINEDVHAPAPFRVLGPLSNFPEFTQTYQCTSGKTYYSTEASACHVW